VYFTLGRFCPYRRSSYHSSPFKTAWSSINHKKVDNFTQNNSGYYSDVYNLKELSNPSYIAEDGVGDFEV
jgi:hypothetical protein